MITLAAGACQGLMRLNEPPPAASAHLVTAATHSGAPWEWGSQVVGKKNHNRGVGNVSIVSPGEQIRTFY